MTSKRDEFEFDTSGEALAYISLEQARVLAMRDAQQSPGAYGRRLINEPMAFELTSEEENDDYYVITLLFRPQGDFSGSSGTEQFFIEKEGHVSY